MKKILAIGVLVAAASVSTTASALTATGNLQVDASVAASCSVAGATLDFGAYDPTSGTDLDGATTVDVTCVKDTPYTVYITGARAMSNGTDNLNFELYTDAGRTAVWGNTLGTGEGFTATSSAALAWDIFGRVTAGQNVGVGSYTTNLTVTVEY